MQSGHLEVARLLLDHGANVNARQRNHWTPAHVSTSHGYLGIVKLLLETWRLDVHAVNSEGQTPYQESLAYGYGEIADLFREHGAGRIKVRLRILYVSNARSDLLAPQF